uniref:1-phosphatidylinositol-3-phosphate 5-kinase FAB1A (Trinotate prediction) n=1 Tax=Henneguya salminicola TaxID=69463 RepID=A0A6G3MIP3_HENSL
MYKITISINSTVKSQHFYIVMENVFYQFPTHKIYDIKGCGRKNIKNSANQVFVDTEIIQNLCENPIYVRHKFLAEIHKILRKDTRFLEENFLVDYSLIVGINNDQNIIRFAIIDYLRKYTWDKRLESAWKSGFMKATSGGGAPTIVAPMEYRMRFMDAFKLYFYPAPFKWDFMEIVKSGSTSDAYFINKTEEEKYNLIKYCKPLRIQDILT